MTKLTAKQVANIFINKKKFDLKKLDELMEKTLGVENFCGDQRQKRIPGDKLELVIGVLDAVVNGGNTNGGNKSEEDKTDSRSAQVREADGYENNGLQGERERPINEPGLDGLRSVQEVPDSSDVSNLQPEGGADAERGLYDN